MLRQLMRRGSDDSDAELSPGERQAFRLDGGALYAVIVLIVATTGLALISGIHAEPSGAGLGLTVGALIVMTVLWRWRLHLADLQHSPALKADAECSAVCLYMAAITLVGPGPNQLFGWWWADRWRRWG